MLEEAYGDYCPTIRTVELWFKRLKEGDFDVEDRERQGQPKKFEDQELETLLSEDSRQTLDEVSEQLGVNRSTVSKRLKALGFIQKQGNWLPHELKPRDVERRLMT